METTYVKVGGEVFNWPRLRACSNTAKLLWIGLYVSQRRVLPGLFVAGLPAIADVVKMTPDDTLVALDELIADRDLIEYDRDREVLRMTEFPDRCERPQNGRHIRSLWTRFRSVPACQVRDAHIRTLEWLLHDPSKPPTDDHVKAWNETFGTIRVPVHRHRGVRRLLDSDTSTSVQPGLFTKETETVSVTTKSIPYPIPYTDTHRSTIYDPRSSLSSSGQSTLHANASEEEQISLPRPQLALVPLPQELPFSIADLLAAVASESAGRFAAGPVDDRLADALVATLRACKQAEVTLDDARLVGRWFANGGLGFRTDLGPVWLAKPGNLLDAIGQARAWRDRGEGRVDERASARRVVPQATPAPSSAFGSGRKALR